MISSEKPLLTTSQSAGNSSNFWLVSSYDILRYIDAFLKQGAPFVLYCCKQNYSAEDSSSYMFTLGISAQWSAVLSYNFINPSCRAKNTQKQKNGQWKCSQPHSDCETAAQKHHSELRAHRTFKLTQNNLLPLQSHFCPKAFWRAVMEIDINSYEYVVAENCKWYLYLRIPKNHYQRALYFE